MVAVRQASSGRSPWGLAAAAIAFILPLLAAPFGIVSGYWSARECAVIALAPLSLAVLTVVGSRFGARVVVVPAGFLAWATLCTVVSTTPWLSFWGSFGIGTGLVFVAALVACWVLGRLVGREVRLIHAAIVATSAASALVAIVQVRIDLPEYGMGLVEGRADAMTGNPVFLGSLLAAAYWVTASLVAERRALLGAALVLGIGVQLSGSRIALLAMVAAVLLVRAELTTRIALVVITTAGLVAGSMLPLERLETTGSARLSSASGISARTEMWSTAVDAVVADPLTGAGPGMFQPATSGRRTLEFVRSEGVAKYYFDAHNLAVEYAVTTGLVGLLLLAAWILLSLRRIDLRSPLGGFAIVVLLTHALQPQSAVLTPLAFLALGAAPPRALAREEGRSASGSQRVALAGGFTVSTAVGILAASTALVGFWMLDQARLDFGAQKANWADRLLPDPWWQAKEQRARVVILRAREANAREFPVEAIQLRKAAADGAPDDPRPLLNLADTYLQVGELEQANRTLERVLDVDPWSVPALNARARTAIGVGDQELARLLLRRSLDVLPAQKSAAELLASLR